MGAANSSSDSGQGGGFPGTNLTSEEVSTLKQLFSTFNTQVVPGGSSGKKGEKTLCSSASDFRGHCGRYLDPWLAGRVVEELSEGGKALIPLPAYLSFVSTLLKGMGEEKVDLIVSLASPRGQKGDSVKFSDLDQYTKSLVLSYFKCLEESPSLRSWSDAGVDPPSQDSVSLSLLTEFLLQDPSVSQKDVLLKTTSTTSGDSLISKDDLLKIFMSSSLLQELTNSVAASCFRLEVDDGAVDRRLLPLCVLKKGARPGPGFSLLDPSKMLFLNSHIPQELRSKWRFLFSTAIHGESFSKLLGEIQGKGPTLLIMRDGGGRVFGAFAPSSWAQSPRFFGERDAFLFHLHPKFLLYPSTGYNDNFQYLNTGQQTLPNGLAFGGKLEGEYFGIFLSSDFGVGRAAPTCTTFSSPQMASTQDFHLSHLEVWGVGPEPKNEEEEGDRRSALDKNPDAKAVLEMEGKIGHSDGWRDEPRD